MKVKSSVKLVALNTGDTDLSAFNALKVELTKKSTNEIATEIDNEKHKRYPLSSIGS